VRKIQQTNNLLRGELSSIEAAAPTSKAYQSGCVKVRGFDIRPSGLTPMRIPSTAQGKPAKYRATQYRGAYYIRNTSDPLVQDWATLPAEDPTYYRSLPSKLIDISLAGGPRAGFTDKGSQYYQEFKDSGRYDQDRGGAVARLIDFTGHSSSSTTDLQARTLVLTKDTKIYRGFSTCFGMNFAHSAGFDDNAPELTGWGAHARRTISRQNGNGVEHFTVYGAARGGGHDRAKKDINILGDSIWIEQEVVLLYEVLPAGIYRFDQDITLVGTTKMFKDAPQQRWYDARIHHYNGVFGTTTATVNFPEDRKWAEADDGLVLFWGAGSAAEAAGPWTLPSNTKLGTVPASAFWFTSRTTIVGSRRFGPAQFEGDSQLFGASAISKMGGSNDDGRIIPSTNITADAAYCLKLEGGVVWFEQVMEGILIGTRTGEYLLQNHQVNPILSGGAALPRISSVGSPGIPETADGNLLSASANLAGDVFYISTFGITTLDFTNEGQTYLPRNLEFKGRRFSGHRATSLASSQTEHCLYVAFDDGSLWKVWPDLAALAEVPITMDAGAKLEGVFQRDGEARLLITAADGSRIDVPTAVASCRDCYLEPTAFGRAPGTRAQIRKVTITGASLLAGEVQIRGKWVPIPITPDDLTAGGITGQVSFLVSDTPAPEGQGKTVPFRFLLADSDIIDPGTISGITVDMEV